MGIADRVAVSHVSYEEDLCPVREFYCSAVSTMEKGRVFVFEATEAVGLKSVKVVGIDSLLGLTISGDRAWLSGSSTRLVQAVESMLRALSPHSATAAVDILRAIDELVVDTSDGGTGADTVPLLFLVGSERAWLDRPVCIESISFGHPLGEPDLFVLIPNIVIRWSRLRHSAKVDVWYEASESDTQADRSLAAIRRISAAAETSVAAPSPAHPILPTVGRDEYASMVLRAKDHIARGDIYQVQIGHELVVDGNDCPAEVYIRLSSSTPAAFTFQVSVGDVVLTGASPESLLAVAGRRLEMRPLAGTIAKPEGRFASRSLILRSDPKEVAEHVMLVDLCRNDLGRVALPGSRVARGILTPGLPQIPA